MPAVIEPEGVRWRHIIHAQEPGLERPFQRQGQNAVWGLNAEAEV
jgi:hypothetical protein